MKHPSSPKATPGLRKIAKTAKIMMLILAAAFPSASLAGKQEGRPAAAETLTGQAQSDALWLTGRVERVIDPPQVTLNSTSGRAGGHGHCFTGTVTRVIDGDTIVVGTNPADSNAVRRTSIVRLAEIDAPELKTEFGPASKAALSAMILHKQVVVVWDHRGRYGRMIGQVYLPNARTRPPQALQACGQAAAVKPDSPATLRSCGRVIGHVYLQRESYEQKDAKTAKGKGVWVNHAMVEHGWAWQFRRYSRSQKLAEAERQARRRLLGVWEKSELKAEADGSSVLRLSEKHTTICVK